MNTLRNLTRSLRKDFEKKLASEIKHNPKAFWKYANSKLRTRSKISDLDCGDGNIASSDKDKAATLNDFFSSVFTEEEQSNIPHLDTKYTGSNPLDWVEIDQEKVRKKLVKLQKNKSAGPDGFHPKVLSEIASSISLPLSIIYNKSLDKGDMPQDWKDANITPIHKKGSRRQPGNYRPISLTAVVCKIMEALVRDDIVKHMIKNSLFADQQHGFVPDRSCMTQLLVFGRMDLVFGAREEL